MTQQSLTPKESLLALIRSHVAATLSGDNILQEYAGRNLSNYLEQIEVTLIVPDEPQASDLALLAKDLAPLADELQSEEVEK